MGRQTLAKFRVLSQIDHKFILCLASQSLVLVDQHAADERIRLEKLEDVVFGPQRNLRNYDRHVLQPPERLYVTTHELHLLQRYREALQQWGFGWSVPSTQSAATRRYLSLTNVPIIFEIPLSGHDLQEFLFELDQQHGNSRVFPPAITRILHLRACRGAIKFGDPLPLEECRNIISNLSSCRLPFQCAHGRPSMTPILAIPDISDALNSQLRNARCLRNIEKLGFVIRK
eukprot:TRINITY_DN11218_c0_g1_i3.p1 TRINITY_DN11218_c0_g1~~TRINITY_DN11218_c0_g1_i3.p1  ORF type:complete len:238 (-),score=41.03 TRINITY_DN11218_c0_g1_i3:50-739(-)